RRVFRCYSSEPLMERRAFLSSALGTTLMAAAGVSPSSAAQGSSAAPAPECYLWRQYVLRTGTHQRRLGAFLQTAAIPARNRLGHKPIGAFEVVFGLPTPGVFVLTPLSSLEKLAALESGLDKDEPFMKAADAYYSAPATDPVYVRQEVSVLT